MGEVSRIETALIAVYQAVVTGDDTSLSCIAVLSGFDASIAAAAARSARSRSSGDDSWARVAQLLTDTAAALRSGSVTLDAVVAELSNLTAFDPASDDGDEGA